ncbi:MAG: preprotein translocase subunit SecG [Dehalococcoidia bacterium]
MKTYMEIAQLIVAIVLIIALLLQVRGGGLGGIFGQQTGAYRTKRGIEKTLFRMTIVMMIIFVLISIFAVRVS